MSSADGIRRDQLITLEDLDKFRNELLTEIRNILDGSRHQEEREWLRSTEVRRMLGVSPGTLQNFRVNGTLSFTKVGGIVFYKREDIVRLLEGNRIKQR